MPRLDMPKLIDRRLHRQVKAESTRTIGQPQHKKPQFLITHVRLPSAGKTDALFVGAQCRVAGIEVLVGTAHIGAERIGIEGDTEAVASKERSGSTQPSNVNQRRPAKEQAQVHDGIRRVRQAPRATCAFPRAPYPAAPQLRRSVNARHPPACQRVTK